MKNRDQSFLSWLFIRRTKWIFLVFSVKFRYEFKLSEYNFFYWRISRSKSSCEIKFTYQKQMSTETTRTLSFFSDTIGDDPDVIVNPSCEILATQLFFTGRSRPLEGVTDLPWVILATPFFVHLHLRKKMQLLLAHCHPASVSRFIRQTATVENWDRSGEKRGPKKATCQI